MSFPKIPSLVASAVVAVGLAIPFAGCDRKKATSPAQPIVFAAVASPLMPESFPKDLQEYAIGLFRDIAKKRMDAAELLVAFSRLHNNLRKDRENIATELVKAKAEGDAMWEAFEKTPDSNTVFYGDKEHPREIFRVQIKLHLGKIKKLDTRRQSTVEGIGRIAAGIVSLELALKTLNGQEAALARDSRELDRKKAAPNLRDIAAGLAAVNLAKIMQDAGIADAPARNAREVSDAQKNAIAISDGEFDAIRKSRAKK
ncbi:MAG: hypothetical protein LBT53_03475 [Puniceicoccales bacterium]|jgi:hypothetical protein|nr:hypothetical protein [Puniceicoccales bacterium]